MVRKEVNKDLVKERKNATFEIAELTNFLDGNKEKTNRRKELGNYTFLFLFLFNSYCLYFIFMRNLKIVIVEKQSESLILLFCIHKSYLS